MKTSSGPICSVDLSGPQPTTGTRMAPIVPMTKRSEYARCSFDVKRPRKKRTTACAPIRLMTKTKPPHAATMHTYASPAITPHTIESRVARPSVAVGSLRSARTQQKKVADMQVSAIDSLSYPPPTERIRCAGTIDMIPAATTPEAYEPEHSLVSRPRKHVADTPNHAGTKQHTSLSDMDVSPTVRRIARQIATETICIPG